MAYRSAQATSVPSSFLNAPMFELYFAIRCIYRIEVSLRCGHAELTFSKSLSSVNGRNATSSRLKTHTRGLIDSYPVQGHY